MRKSIVNDSHHHGPSIPFFGSRVGEKVQPGFHNENFCAVLKTPAIHLAGKHTKVRRVGYRRA
jgi:hypothetical protein